MASLPPGADSDQVRAPFPTRVSKSFSRRHATYSPCAVLPFDWAASASQFALRAYPSYVVCRPLPSALHPLHAALARSLCRFSGVRLTSIVA